MKARDLALALALVAAIFAATGCGDGGAANDYKSPENKRSADVKADESGDK
ncbi:MAG: hypothetical protein SFX74_11695 [Fimbriimonadaceae bacterium]|nr:hypothetical protein [Fimbriimonadaceae bacterium]